MAIELKVPGFPESVADGTILKWNKKPGEAVRREEPVVEIETDKVVFEVPAPSDGVSSSASRGCWRISWSRRAPWWCPDSCSDT